jgi:hypothetical protein
VHIVGLQDIEDTIITVLPKTVLRRIYLDFEPYYEQFDLAHRPLALPDSHSSQTLIRDLHVGMGWSEFIAIMGSNPDTSYSVQCGENIKRPWNGLVCKYYREEPDPRFGLLVKKQTPRRRITDTYVFHYDEGNRRLNHWSLGSEEISEWKDGKGSE